MPPFGADELTVIIPTRARWPILARTLDGLAAQTVKGFEIIVVVDGEDDDVPDLPGVRVIVKAHGGPGAARNAGAAAATTPLILFLGDDIIPTPGFIEHHLERHNREPDETVAVLGHVQWHPSLRGDRLNKWLDWSHAQFDYDSIIGDDAGFGRFFSCNVSLKRTFFLGAGGFDEDFTYYYEDLDCGWRLNDHGLRLRYEPDALTHHLHRYDWRGIERRMEGTAVGERMMMAKHPGFQPWFAERMRAAADSKPRSLIWPVLVDLVPARAPRVRAAIERRAGDTYFQHLAPAFFNAWQADRDLEELKAYLGDDFDEDRFYGHRQLVDDEEESATDEATFYRTSNAYLYDLTAFGAWMTKVPYMAALRRCVPVGSKVLDYGCGIGNDGLRLTEDGYRVSFADFDNPSTQYLRWRLARRGIDAEVYDIEREVPGGFDAAFSFDVIEHVPDPWAFLSTLEDRAAIVAVNLLEPDPEDTHLHKPLPIPALLDHAADRGLLWYRRYHGRSHLMIYRSNARGGARSRVERLIGGRLPQLGMGHLDRLTLRRRRA
jgi:glycosyltransferase involved in cell wall biosynthesis